jgi:acetylornithine/succinyldiaminopimelate/putrescine aminotransferase
MTDIAAEIAYSSGVYAKHSIARRAGDGAACGSRRAQYLDCMAGTALTRHGHPIVAAAIADRPTG